MLPVLFPDADDSAPIKPSTDGTCGPVAIASFIPDCPLDLVCFTTACETHNRCYGLCGMSKIACDNQFYAGMLAICARRLGVLDPDFEQCQSLAFTYWSSVALLGDEAFAATQASLCGPANAPPPPRGVCCRGGAVCEEDAGETECIEPSDRFFPALTCEAFDCRSPAGDACEMAEQICDEPQREPDTGVCRESPEQPCFPSNPDCLDDSPCEPDPLVGYRCVIDTDNRLASTDGPPGGGACVASGEQAFQADVWYRYVPPCSGRLTVRMCDRPGYDAMLAVYGTGEADTGCACPPDDATLLDCDDDFCGGGSTSAVILDHVIRGACYTIRVGGWSADGLAERASQGTSELDIYLQCDTGQDPNGEKR